MKSTLVPEKPILVHPSLAATVGLDESVMLSVLSEIVTHQTGKLANSFEWFELNIEILQASLPFWDRRDLHRVSTSLRDKGIILIASAPIINEDNFKFAFNEKPSVVNNPQAQPVTPAPAPQRNTAFVEPRTNADNQHNPNFLSKNYIAANWQPDQSTLDQLAQLSIPQQFAMQHVPEFITYWRERGEAHRSWGSKFIKHTLHQWRNHEAKQNRNNAEHHMHGRWRPSEDAMKVLVQHAAIPQEFIEDAIPEFILYWQERGDKLQTWNSKFIQHVRVQWKKFNSALESNSDPRPIPASWQPSADVADVLRLANIDAQFAQQLIPEFVLYWRDNGQAHTSWNTRYLQHVKRQWAKRHDLEINNANQQQRSTRDISLEEQLTDRSWAS